MLAAALVTVSVLAPSGVTAAIQADPVCLPAAAQPGHSYPLTVYVSGSAPMALAVTPAHGSLERTLHQVPSSWISFASNPAGSGTDALTLSIPGDAAPGAYWSDVVATAGSKPGAGAQAALGAAATTAIVFAVGTTPPPCDALDLAQSTGRRPAWPTAAFRTTGWKQLFAEEARDNPKPVTSPTAGTGNPAPAAVQYAPASPAASQGSAGPNRDGWVVLAVLTVIGLAALAKRRRS